MSVKVELTCTKHKKYEAKRPPTATCPACAFIHGTMNPVVRKDLVVERVAE